jgi:hypothetical protein
MSFWWVQMTEGKRYQECSWYVKLWRCRHYWSVPFYTVRTHFRQMIRRPDGFWNTWGIYVGLAQVEMNYVYTSEEAFARFDLSLNEEGEEE